MPLELHAEIRALAAQVLDLDPDLRRPLLHLERRALDLERSLAETTQDLQRHQQLLERALQLNATEGAAPIAAEVLDVMISQSGAERGFVGVVDPRGGWRFLAARALHERDILDPASEVSTTVIDRALHTGVAVLSEDAQDEAWSGQGSVQRLGLRSVACLPIARGPRVLGFVYVDNRDGPHVFDEAVLRTLERWLPMVTEHLARALGDEEVHPFPEFTTRSPTFLDELTELARLARFDVSVLVTGQTGTGKSRLAKAIHARSRRADGPFVHLNCSAIPEALFESEFFGAEAGAYTGALRQHIGRFESAQGGTLFLDELDTMPHSGQVKLLVALQEKQITRLGSAEPVRLDVRIVAATNADPEQAIADGRLRQDLFFRLAKVQVHLPPLAERKEDLPALVQDILARAREQYELPALRIGASALDQLYRHHWPGNVRELENVLDRAALLAGVDGLINHLRIPGTETRAPRRLSVGSDEFHEAYEASGNNASDTARRLGVSKRSVFRMKKKFLADDPQS